METELKVDSILWLLPSTDVTIVWKRIWFTPTILQIASNKNGRGTRKLTRNYRKDIVLGWTLEFSYILHHVHAEDPGLENQCDVVVMLLEWHWENLDCSLSSWIRFILSQPNLFHKVIVGKNRKKECYLCCLELLNKILHVNKKFILFSNSFSFERFWFN